MNTEPRTYRFEVTADHLALLSRAYVRWEDCEYGAPAIDCKRPYGNGDVPEDIADILGWSAAGDEIDALEARCRRVHEETLFALQAFLGTGSWGAGVFEVDVPWWAPSSPDPRSWRRVAESDAPPLPLDVYVREIGRRAVGR